MEDTHFEVLKSMLLSTKGEIIATIAPVIRDQAELKDRVGGLEGRVNVLESDKDQRLGEGRVRTALAAGAGFTVGAGLQLIGNLLSGKWPLHF